METLGPLRMASNIVKQQKAGDLCNKCRNLPWRSIVDMFGVEYGWQLTPSICRICRFIQDFMIRENISVGGWEGFAYPGRGRRPKCTSWIKANHGGIAHGHTAESAVCVLDFANERPMLDAHMVISTLDHTTTMARLQYLYPREADVEVMKIWIARCESEHHETCSLPEQPRLRDLRVIDCTERKVVAAPRGCTYVALSYVWGETSASMARVDSDHLSLGSLPIAIRQAITLTQDLGFKYLWIDRYVGRLA